MIGKFLILLALGLATCAYAPLPARPPARSYVQRDWSVAGCKGLPTQRFACALRGAP
jgi:hypothetical protein